MVWGHSVCGRPQGPHLQGTYCKVLNFCKNTWAHGASHGFLPCNNTKRSPETGDLFVYAEDSFVYPKLSYMMLSGSTPRLSR